MKVYIASSWKSSDRHNEVIVALENNGHDYYDYRTHGAFHWSQVDPNYKDWTLDEFLKGLKHPLANKGFQCDWEGMNTCDACILVLPSGKRSSHIEAGMVCR